MRSPRRPRSAPGAPWTAPPQSSRRAPSDNCCLAWRKRIEALCDALFGSIRMQTSMAKHSASGYERGAVLDFVDHPLNNRWWLEDQFTAVRALPDEAARLARLRTLATWTRPGPGSFYDDVGSVAASPHVLRGDSLAPETLEPGGSRHRTSPGRAARAARACRGLPACAGPRGSSTATWIPTPLIWCGST